MAQPKGRPRIKGANGAKLRKRNISVFDYQWKKLASISENGDRSALIRKIIDNLPVTEVR